MASRRLSDRMDAQLARNQPPAFFFFFFGWLACPMVHAADGDQKKKKREILHVTFKCPIFTDNCDSQNFPPRFLLLKEGRWEFVLKVPTDFFIYPAPFECYVQ
jgi:hypothetical protein